MANLCTSLTHAARVRSDIPAAYASRHPHRGQGLRPGRSELPADEICLNRQTTTWTGDDCDEIGRTTPSVGTSRLAGDHPAGCGGGRTHRIGLVMVVGAADA